MPGYGGQEIALNIESPADAQAQWQTVRTSQLANDFAEQDNPLRIASAQMANKQSGLALDEAQRQDPIKARAAEATSQAQWEAQIANATSLIDPEAPDAAAQFDAAMTKLDAAGNPLAKQHVGREFNSAKRDQLIKAYTASAQGNPLAAAGAMADGGVSGLTGMGAPGGGGATPQVATQEQMDQVYGQMPPEQIAQHAQHLGPTIQAAKSVLQSQTPMATFNAAAEAMGHPEMKVQSDQQAIQSAQAIIAHEQPLQQYFQRRMADNAGGLPPPVQQEQLQSAGGTAYAMSHNPDGTIKARALTKDLKLVGTNDDGKGIYTDPSTGDEYIGANKLNAKPGSSSHQTAFEQRLQAAKDIGLTGAAALDRATNWKPMTAAQADVAGAAQAARDEMADAQSGIMHPEGWLADHAKELAAQYRASAAEGTGAPGGGTPAAGGGAKPAAGARIIVPPANAIQRLQQRVHAPGADPAREAAAFDAIFGKNAAAAALRPDRYTRGPDGRLIPR